MDKITSQNDSSVKDYIASLDDEQTVKDSQVLIEMMQRIRLYFSVRPHPGNAHR